MRREAKCSWPSGGLTLPRLLKNEGGKPRCSKQKNSTAQGFKASLERLDDL